MINAKFLLTITFIAMMFIYNQFLPLVKIIDIVVSEYILILLTLFSIIVYIYFRIKLRGKLLFEFIPNTNYVPIKSTVLFFLLFEIIDFYTEDGFKGMISLWFMYWVFGLFAYFLTHNINFYKNYKAYKEKNLV